MKKIVINTLLLLTVACKSNEKKTEPVIQAEPENKTTPVKTETVIPAATDSLVPYPVLTGESLAPEEMQYIGHQENNVIWFNSVKEFNETDPKKLELLYGQPIPDVATLYRLKKERMLAGRKKFSSNYKPIQPKVPAGWEQPFYIAYDTSLADVVYRYGDMDNLGYGWPTGFDPFSGENTPVHGFPFYPEPSDPAGTDRIMVISGYEYKKTGIASITNRTDGYTSATKRPYNNPEKLKLEYDLKGKTVQHALLQIFVDDFQSTSFKSKFRVWLNGKEAVWINSYLNELKQGGPIGKLLSLQVLPEFIPMIQSGKLEILIDGPDTDAGDGFAIDFVQLLINPKDIAVSPVKGKVLDAKSNKPIAGAFIKISGASETESDAEGNFSVNNVPCGMVVIQAAGPGYKGNKVVENVVQDKSATVTIKLEPESDNGMQTQLEEKGKVELYGIYFDSDKATLKPESENTLQQVLALINNKPGQQLEIGGHTDSQGDDAYNLQLSEKRAQAVVQWLKNHTTNVSNLSSKGYGETEPVADNSTETGRALNRRVEIKLVNK